MVILWTDALLYLLLILFGVVLRSILKKPYLRQRLQENCALPLRIAALLVLLTFVGIGLLDSLHFRQENKVLSVLDLILLPSSAQTESTYSAPFATDLFVEHMEKTDGENIVWVKEKLVHVDPVPILRLLAGGLIIGGIFGYVILLIAKLYFRRINTTAKVTAYSIVIILVTIKLLMLHYHVLGTDKVGLDVLYASFKSIRTGLVIGTVTTLVTLPFAILFGTLAGYMRGWVDDVIQYVYTTLSSIPGVLLIAAAVLTLDAVISRYDNLFSLMAQRTDMRTLILCIILGVTSWTVLCRILRAETLKLREQDFVLASRVMGANSLQIIWRHIVPNLAHIIIITIALDFSALVLAEAVLSYVGVGVDPSTFSWGNMINSARMELGREPVIWWSLVGAFSFMFMLVLAANIFADAVRDALDPRAVQHVTD